MPLAARSCRSTFIGRAILVHEPAVGVGAHHVDIGARGDVARIARADLQINGSRGGFVDQMMAVSGALRKGRAIAGTQQRFAAVLDQRHFTFENIHELVLVAVPVALARPATRRQGRQVDAEIAKPARVAKTPARALCTRRIERRRIARSLTCRYGGDIDFWHRCSVAYSALLTPRFT